MKTNVLWKLAKKSLLGHKQVIVPYILANTSLFAGLYILVSLMSNSYIQEHHSALPSLLEIGVIVGILVVVAISFYTSLYIQREWTKSYGMYTVLGLEKKHVSRLSFYQLFISYIIIAISSPILGYVSGNILFVVLNRFLRDTGANLLDYPVDLRAAVIVVGILTVLYIFIYLLTIGKIYRLNTISLLKENRKGSREPKSRWLLLVIGLGMTGYGYYLAWTTENILQSLGTFLNAVILVLIGTYFLLGSLMTIVLKLMKKNKKYYYKPSNFLTVSGMLERISKNAIALATISILVTGVVLMSGLTVTTYRAMEGMIDSVAPREYVVSSEGGDQADLENILSEVQEVTNVESEYIQTTSSLAGEFIDGEVVPLAANVGDMSGEQVYYVITTKEDHYQYLGENTQSAEKLANESDSWLITSNLLDIEDVDSVEVNGHTNPVEHVSDEAIPSAYGIEVIYLAVNSQEESENLTQHLSENISPQPVPSTELAFNVEENSSKVEDDTNKIVENHGAQMETRREATQSVYELNGGLLFIGILISFLLLVGTALMLYYRQISQGLEDRSDYQIMMKVGLPEPLIKKTINKQVLWMFFLPLLVGAIHNIAIGKIIYSLLGMMGVNEISVYITSFVGVLIVFALLYLVFYWLTSRVYYRLVHGE